MLGTREASPLSLAIPCAHRGGPGKPRAISAAISRQLPTLSVIDAGSNGLRQAAYGVHRVGGWAGVPSAPRPSTQIPPPASSGSPRTHDIKIRALHSYRRVCGVVRPQRCTLVRRDLHGQNRRSHPGSWAGAGDPAPKRGCTPTARILCRCAGPRRIEP